MKHSDSNHLRRLIGWVSCEIGQTPEELVATVQNIAAKLGPVDIADAGRQRMVEAHDKARAVPAYVHAALKALRKATDTMGEVVEPVPAGLNFDLISAEQLSKLPRRERLFISDEYGITLEWGGADYEIPWGRLKTQDQLLDWICQVGEKSWEHTTPWRIARFIDVVAHHNGWKTRGSA